MLSKKNKLFKNANKNMSHLDVKTLGDKTYVHTIKLDEISPNPYQPRKVYDQVKLELFGENIKNQGLDHPITVVSSENGYTLVMGERRVRASRLAKLGTIRALIVKYDDDMMLKKALWENILREDLTPLEVYETLVKIMEVEKISNRRKLAKQINMSYQQISSLMSFGKISEELIDLYKNTAPTVAIQVIERLSTVPVENSIKYFKHIVASKLSRAKALEYIGAKENKTKSKKTNASKSTKLWGKTKTTKLKYEIQINRASLSPEVDAEVQKKLEEIKKLVSKK